MLFPSPPLPAPEEEDEEVPTTLLLLLLPKLDKSNEYTTNPQHNTTNSGIEHDISIVNNSSNDGIVSIAIDLLLLLWLVFRLVCGVFLEFEIATTFGVLFMR